MDGYYSYSNVLYGNKLGEKEKEYKQNLRVEFKNNVQR